VPLLLLRLRAVLAVRLRPRDALQRVSLARRLLPRRDHATGLPLRGEVLRDAVRHQRVGRRGGKSLIILGREMLILI
jgi:hypothetical protein